MSIITDLGKSVRSRIVGERVVVAAGKFDNELHSGEPASRALEMEVLAASEVDELSKPVVKTIRRALPARTGPGRRLAELAGAKVLTSETSLPADTPTGPSSEAGMQKVANAAPTKPVTKQSKSAIVVRLLERAEGAALAEVMDVTGWLAHSARGFLSGTVRKKIGLNLISETDGDGIRRYRILVDAFEERATPGAQVS